MIITSLKLDMTPIPNPIYETDNRMELPNLDDDTTMQLHSKVLPIEVQLMLVPMWTLRSKYADCMRPLDLAMEQYMKFRGKLQEIDLQIELDTATDLEIAMTFDQILSLLSTYEKNQEDLQEILREVNRQIMAYAQASKDDLLWNEMLQLREIDYISFTRRTCTFEHIVNCLFKLDENVKESLLSSAEISDCCVKYLVKITKLFNRKECKPGSSSTLLQETEHNAVSQNTTTQDKIKTNY